MKKNVVDSKKKNPMDFIISVKNAKVLRNILIVELVAVFGLSVAIANDIASYVSLDNTVKNNVENEVIVKVVDKPNNDYMLEQNRLAFYFQSCVDKDGSITNPKFFSKLSREVQVFIIRTKDLNKKMLDEFLSRPVSDSDKILFEKELENQLEGIKFASDIVINER